MSPYPNLLVMKIASIFACLWGALTQAVVINVNLTSVGYNYAAILEVISQHSNRIFVPSVLSSANDNQFVYSLYVNICIFQLMSIYLLYLLLLLPFSERRSIM